MKEFITAIAALAVVGGFVLATDAAWAQDLDAKKTPGQLFSQTCVACHRGPQGLAKGKPPGQIAGFLKQHYTSSAKTAGELASYLAAAKGEPPRERGGRAGRQTPPPEPVGTPPAASQAAATDKPKTRAERRKEREERRARAEERARTRAAAHTDSGDVPVVKRPRRAGEPATVTTDPAPVIISAEPTPVFHDRALSRAQENREWPAEPSAQPPAQTAAVPAAPAGGATPAASQPPAGQTAVIQGAQPPVGQPSMVAPAPADTASQGLAAPSAAANGAAQPAAPEGATQPAEQPVAGQVFSTPLP